MEWRRKQKSRNTPRLQSQCPLIKNFSRVAASYFYAKLMSWGLVLHPIQTFLWNQCFTSSVSFSTRLQHKFLHPAAWIFYSDSSVLPYMFDTLFPPSPSLSASVFLFWQSIQILVGGCQAEHSYEPVRVERRERSDASCLRWRKEAWSSGQVYFSQFFIINSKHFFHSATLNWSQKMENITV